MYDIVIDSIAIDTTEKRFGGAEPDGKPLLHYVIAHGNTTSAAAQIVAKAELKALTIEPTAKARQIDSIWKQANRRTCISSLPD